MAVHYSAKAVAILGGVIWPQTDEVLFQGIVKSTTTWRLKFAVTLASRSQKNSNPAFVIEIFNDNQSSLTPMPFNLRAILIQFLKHKAEFSEQIKKVSI